MGVGSVMACCSGGSCPELRPPWPDPRLLRRYSTLLCRRKLLGSADKQGLVDTSPAINTMLGCLSIAHVTLLDAYGHTGTQRL